MGKAVMPKFTNKHNIPLPLAVMLAHDDYDHNDDPYTISATSLLKSTRQLVLATRSTGEEEPVDISTLIASTQGTALHDALEKAWLSPKLPETLKALGLTASVAEQVRVNPTDGKAGRFDIFMEIRKDKKIGRWTISGKFDFIMEGIPHDLKNTSTFKWSGSHQDYIDQLSIYRWLNPDLTKEDLGRILFWFKDYSEWSSSKAGYPPFPLVQKELNLRPPRQTEKWIKDKLDLVEKHLDTPEPELPLCTSEELWQSPSKFKYYSKPDAVKASKVFDSMTLASSYMMGKGKGRIVEAKGEARACKYCNVRSGCSQYGQLVQQGLIKD
ncbi:exonuclease [Vibrio phage D292]